MLDLPWTTLRGLRALKALAREDGPLTSGALAREVRLTPSRAASLLRLLKAAELIAPAGHKGWTLARPAGDITVLEAAEALGMSRPHPEDCRAGESFCPDHGDCALSPLCRQAHESLLEVFRGHTLADLRAVMPVLP
jgi:DNA-binding IscR family transcriptional regulator